ncbi:MAG: 50S ribosomal protein L4 [Candidatus Promineifilaceae bacterium]|nr:50S ribosomal protein L4 [Candidatus Promineifilaceae bacterium]
MKAKVFSMTGQEIESVELPAAVFEAKINRDLMHQALVRQLANARLGTHKTKGRSEITKSTAKIYRQKGTGNARHGSRRAPIFVGGGVAHGPHPRKYAKQMPRRMRRAALRSALSAKAGSGDLVIIDEVSMDAPKTKEMVAFVNNHASGKSALLLLAEADANLEKSARNLPDVKTLRANYLNIRDLLGYDKVLMPLAALNVVNEILTADIVMDEAYDSLEEEE